MSRNKKSSQFYRVHKTDNTTLIPLIQGNPLFNAIITPEDLAKGLFPYMEVDFTPITERIDAVDIELENKVDKIEGYSLVKDTEIEKLAALTDTGDVDLSAVELLENKQNSLLEDNTGVKFPTVDAVIEGLETKVDKEYGKSLVDDEEILRLATLENVSIEHLATKEELESKVDKEVGKSLVSDEEILRLSTVTNQDISDLATKGELDNLVVKEAGKSLILDTEIERLKSITNQTLEGLGAEDVNNKKSIINEESDTEYPTSKAVADYITEKVPNNDILNQVTATGSYALPLNRQTQITEELTGTNTFTLTEPFEGVINESVVHFRVGSAVPTLAYDFTPLWLNEAEIELKADKSYTLVFEQLKQGVEWVIKASWGEY